MTYSIIAFDRVKGLAGVAVASGSVAVGSRVPWCRYGTACVATQAYTNPSLGPKIIKLCSQGLSAESALNKALKSDPDPSKRQVGVIDFKGVAACYTGAEAPPEKGCVKGVIDGLTYVVIGNLLKSEEVVKAAASALIRSYRSGDDLINALINALESGREAGGDSRGERSAAVLIVGETEWGVDYDRLLDVRIDLSRNPLRDLKEVINALTSSHV